VGKEGESQPLSSPDGCRAVPPELHGSPVPNKGSELALALGETLLGTALLVPLARADWQRLSPTTFAHNQNRKVRRR
jgi:hypothetical protein